MTFTLNNPRKKQKNKKNLHLNVQEAYFPPTTKADSLIIHSDSQENEVPPRHTSYSRTWLSGYTYLCQQQQADKSKDGNEGLKPWL